MSIKSKSWAHYKILKIYRCPWNSNVTYFIQKTVPWGVSVEGHKNNCFSSITENFKQCAHLEHIWNLCYEKIKLLLTETLRTLNRLFKKFCVKNCMLAYIQLYLAKFSHNYIFFSKYRNFVTSTLLIVPWFWKFCLFIVNNSI